MYVFYICGHKTLELKWLGSIFLVTWLLLYIQEDDVSKNSNKSIIYNG
jgi:hypothetical protein